ncbi:MAG: HAMP domain-containing protein [Anaerolineae bacterium]
MPETVVNRVGKQFWAWAGRVPLRAKIIGIVVSALGAAGFCALIWFHVRMSHLLGEGVSSPTMELSEPIFVAALSVIVGFFIAWLLTVVLTRPVRDMTRVARRVHQGDLSQRVTVWADDELGELARSFNMMIDRLVRSQLTLEATNLQLTASNEELSLLYALAGMSASTTLADGILSAGLARIAEAIHADAGLVLWPAPGGALAVAADYQTPACLINAVSAAVRDRLTTPAADEAGALTALVAAAAPRCGFQSYSVMPVRVRDEVKGLLLVFCQRPNLIDENASSLLNAASNQLAVAVESATLWEELKLREATRTKFVAQAVTAQEQERERISRELHDETGQALTTLLIQLKVLERLRDWDAVAAHAQELREIVVNTLEEVRRLARDLRPAMLDDLGLVPTLDGHIKTFRNKADIDVEFDVDVSEDFRLPRDTELALYRMVQEALTNVARHAAATKVYVRLEQVSDAVSLSVVDNGRGFDLASVLKTGESGVGLLGIRERVELIGGTFTLASSPGQGTRLRVDVDADMKAEAL